MLILFLATGGAAELASNQNRPPLLLVSFDGFRADYLRRFHMPNLEHLYSHGVLVEELTNAFITKTFPNHYTLVRSLCQGSLPPFQLLREIHKMIFIFHLGYGPARRVPWDPRQFHVRPCDQEAL